MTKDVEELRNLNLDMESLKARKEAIKQHIKQHRDELSDNEILSNTNEANELKTKIEEKQKEIDAVQERIAKNQNEKEKRAMENLEIEKRNLSIEDAEKRAKEFASTGKLKIDMGEVRSVLVSSGKLATPTKVSGINEMFNNVSSLVDQVYVNDCNGMGSNKVAYEKTASIADETDEGDEYKSSDPEFDFVEIKPTTITTISYISKQTQNQTPLQYEAKVRAFALKALRNKTNALIVSKIKASKLIKKIEGLTAIDEFTLRKIALAYGGDENVVGNAVLYLNKESLMAFGDVRGKNEKKATYEITPNTENPNTGTIKDGGLVVAYTICSKLKKNDLIYGQPVNCELDLFSDYSVEVSKDFKFDTGLLAIRGDVELGADVVKLEGFVEAVIGGTTSSSQGTTTPTGTQGATA